MTRTKKEAKVADKRYRRIVAEIYAVQNNGDISVLEADYEWVVKALQDGKIRTGLINAAALQVQTPDGVKRADPGDWITRDDSGNLNVIRADEFENEYEEVPVEGMVDQG
jgi:hypothetical protein